MISKKVSVIVPVYNSSKYLWACLSALASQTYENLEVILVDDASTDDSFSLCNAYAKKYANFRVIRNEKNLGAGESRNIGVKNAGGDFISFIDADDYPESDLIEKLVVAACENDSDITICGYKTFETDDNKITETITYPTNNLNKEEINEFFAEEFPDGIVGYLWNKLYKAALVKQIDFGNWARLEDAFFNIEAFSKAESVTIISDVLYNYRKSSQVETIRKVPKDYVIILESVVKEFDKNTDKLSVFYYSEIGSFVEYLLLGDHSLGVFEIRRLLKDTTKSVKSMTGYFNCDNANIYRRLIIKCLLQKNYLLLKFVVTIKVFSKKNISRIFFKVKSKLI